MESHPVVIAFLVFAGTLSYGLDLTPYLQPDVTYDEQYLASNLANLCARKCDGTTRICYYKFEIENYAAMGPACGNCEKNSTECDNRYCITADGVSRNIITVNRQLPGTAIEVCKGDTVVVDVTNALAGKTTTIHWHGQTQHNSPHMDGVYMVTQCPIVPAQTFRYKFVAKDPGTHFWHDHSGLIKEDGVQGALIVREPEHEEPNSHMYDFDLPSHTVFITDWKHYMADNEFPQLNKNKGDSKVTELLINGKGAFPGSNPAQAIMDKKGPIAQFVMEPGKRYRMRVIGAMCMDCPIEFSIENHQLQVIATDGVAIEPIIVDNIVLHTGERYDIVVMANQKVSSYWMKTRGVKPCHSLSQLAVVTYKGSYSDVPLTYPKDSANGQTWSLNLPNYDDKGQGERNIWIANLKAKNSHNFITSSSKYPKHFVHVLNLGTYVYKQEQFTSGQVQSYYQPTKGWNTRTMINNITGGVPPAPMLTQMVDVPKSSFCSEECLRGMSPEKCICIQKIKFPVNATVDFIVADTGLSKGSTHPFHMHGFTYYVLEQGILGKDRSACIQKLYDRVVNGAVKHPSPPGKDTLMVPSGGYAVIRFFTNNPGIWVFHCHYIYHNAMGMNAYVQVGEVEDFPSPPQGFPTCGNFLPPL